MTVTLNNVRVLREKKNGTRITDEYPNLSDASDVKAVCYLFLGNMRVSSSARIKINIKFY